MAQYIDKSAVVAEIKNLIERARAERVLYPKTIRAAKNYLLIEDYKKLLSFIDTLEVKEVETWHLQEKEDIYDAVKDWGLYTFACIMKDGTIQKFIGSMDEDCEGHINVHIDGVNDDYDDVDDIVKWIEFT